MLTLGTLANRPDLGLRFADDRDADRYSGRTVDVVVEGTPLLDTGLREVLVVLSAAPPRWPVLERAAAVVVTGCGDDVPAALAEAARRHAVPLLATADDAPRAWARLFHVVRREQRHETDRRKAIRQAATDPDGLNALLRRLAEEISGHVVLIDSGGRPVSAFPHLPAELLTRARDDVLRVATRRARSALVDLGSQVAYILALGDKEPGAALVVVRDGDFPPRTRDLVIEASTYLYLRWRVEELDRRGRQVDLAEMQSREAVLHLLMLRNLQGARRVTEALCAPLPEVMRVYIIECPPGMRDDYARRCEEVTEGRVWYVRCPVFPRQLIVLSPAESEDSDDPLDDALSSLASSRPDCYVGSGRVVALNDTAAGYQEAYHALAVARGVPARSARFSAREEIPALLGPGGRAWAYRFLRPLLEHHPERRQDPDADELRATLASWLTYMSGAARLLKIHRNTLTARLAHIGRLLDLDLNDLGAQTELHLALRLLDRPPSSGPDDDATLDALLAPPELRHWAETRLSPIGDPVLLETLRTWLNADARLDLTASALGVSVPAARKRLLRIEGFLSRSLLTPPSARYDMVLALRILDLPER